MAAAKKSIKLINARGNVTPFSMEHALALLRLQARRGGVAGWSIDKSEKDWKFGNNEIYRSTGSGASEEPETD